MRQNITRIIVRTNLNQKNRYTVTIEPGRNHTTPKRNRSRYYKSVSRSSVNRIRGLWDSMIEKDIWL